LVLSPSLEGNVQRLTLAPGSHFTLLTFSLAPPQTLPGPFLGRKTILFSFFSARVSQAPFPSWESTFFLFSHSVVLLYSVSSAEASVQPTAFFVSLVVSFADNFFMLDDEVSPDVFKLWLW